MIVAVTAVNMHMTVVVTMRPADAVGPAFRQEGFRNLGHLGPQTRDQIGHHRILTDQQAAVFDLTGGVAIADMPCKTHQIRAADFDKVFFGGHDLDQRPVLKNETIPVIKRNSFRKINEDRLVVHSMQDFASQKPRLVIEGHKV